MSYHLFYTSIDCWNSLSLILKQSKLLNVFKHKLKSVDLAPVLKGSTLMIRPCNDHAKTIYDM